MIRAIYRVAAPGRLGMLAAVVCVSLLARVGGAMREDVHWGASESQATASILILWLVIPVFVTMLGTALFRGEHAPWSWGLARPVSRLRWIGALVALDAATVAACTLAASLVLGELRGAWGTWESTVDGALLAVTAFAYAGLYLLTATAGSRTDSTIRAAAVAVLSGAALVTATTSVFTYLRDHAWGTWGGLHPSWERAYHVYGLASWDGPAQLGVPHTWWLLAALVLVTAAIAAPILAFIRTARLTPGPVPLWPVSVWSGALALVAVALLFLGCVRLQAIAPAEAKKGAITVELVPGGVVQRVDSAYLLFEGVDVPRSLTRIHASSTSTSGARFEGLSPGRFDACAKLVLDPASADDDPHSTNARRCVPIVVTAALTQTLIIDLRSDGLSAEPE